jgi:hypothetical protein
MEISTGWEKMVSTEVKGEVGYNENASTPKGRWVKVWCRQLRELFFRGLKRSVFGFGRQERSAGVF